MEKRDIVVIGASAGGIEACQVILKLLPADLDASVFIVIHVSAQAPSVLAKIFGRVSAMAVKNPDDTEPIKMRQVYVAPSNCHMLLKQGTIKLGRGPRENGTRPSVDALFRTAALAYGPRVIGIVLSGVLYDGTAGLMAIKSHGGLAIVQDPAEAAFSGMPKSALEFVDPDYVMRLKDIAAKIVELVGQPLPPAKESDGTDRSSKSLVYEEGASGLRDGMPGELTGLTCPSCGGSIWETENSGFTQFRCHVGHSFTPESMLQEQSDVIDKEFWRALRRLEENIALRKKLRAWSQDHNRNMDTTLQDEQIALAEKQAAFIRRSLITDVAKLSDPTES